MSGPFKMKYTKSQNSAFPFKGEPLKSFGGMKRSPARSWWNKLTGMFAEQRNNDGGGTSVRNIPQHGPESHLESSGKVIHESGEGGIMQGIKGLFSGGNMNAGTDKNWNQRL